MSRITYFIVFFLFVSLNIFAQLCPDCDSDDEIQYYPRFWEDPDGILYQPESINEPNKLGTWIFFKAIDNNTRQVIFTRDVLCLPSLDGRNRKINSDQIQLFPNPVIEELTIKQPYSNISIEIYDVSGIKVYQNSFLKKNTIKINTSSYNSGIYILQIVSDKEKINKIFMVE